MNALIDFFLMRFQPVLSPAGISNQRNLELIGILHFLYYDFLNLLFSSG